MLFYELFAFFECDLICMHQNIRLKKDPFISNPTNELVLEQNRERILFTAAYIYNVATARGRGVVQMCV